MIIPEDTYRENTLRIYGEYLLHHKGTGGIYHAYYGLHVTRRRHVVGTGFSTELTKLMIEGLLDSHIHIIEMGHCTGLGSVKAGGKACPVTDEEYLEAIAPYADKGEIGMFQTAGVCRFRTNRFSSF